MCYVSPGMKRHTTANSVGHPKDSAVPQLINPARSRRSLAILHHTLGLDRNVVKLFWSSSSMVYSVRNEDISYFVNFMG